jgi:tripartite ATP-independent transporter DctM subunit
MSLELTAIVLLVGLLFLLLIGVEIFVALALVGGLGLWFFIGQPPRQFAVTAFEFMNSFVLTAMPLFVFMGAIFANTGIVKHLFTGADKLLGGWPGGVACSVIGASGIFGAISGSTVASAATFGKLAYPDMERLGYDPKLALGAIAIGGTLSVLIPPSIILIVYGFWERVSVARLFAGAIVPGIILVALLMLTVVIQVKINPSLAPKSPKITWRERLSAFKDIAPFAVVIVLVLGVIFAGIMTPTEAASIGALGSIVLAFAYRKMTFTALKESMWTAARITAMVAFVIFTAKVLGILFGHIGLTSTFAAFMEGLPFGKYGVWAIVCLMYLILGMFFDTISMLLLTLPFISPLIASLGFNPIWFGVTYVVLGEIGIVTPPFGLNLFVIHGVVPKHDIVTIALGALPFIIPTLLMVVILTAFPDLVLWLPRLIY